MDSVPSTCTSTSRVSLMRMEEVVGPSPRYWRKTASDIFSLPSWACCILDRTISVCFGSQTSANVYFSSSIRNSRVFTSSISAAYGIPRSSATPRIEAPAERPVKRLASSRVTSGRSSSGITSRGDGGAEGASGRVSGDDMAGV